jgi:hypothetical protein
MKEFPRRLNVNNKDKFSSFLYDRSLCYFRRDIFEHIISRKDENCYFELDKFCKNYLNNNTEMMEEMKNTVINELHDLGWKCKTSFGNTGLFIYSTENPPSSCYEDTF